MNGVILRKDVNSYEVACAWCDYDIDDLDRAWCYEDDNVICYFCCDECRDKFKAYNTAEEDE